MIKILIEIEHLDSTRFIKNSVVKLRIYKINAIPNINYFISYACDDWELYLKIVKIGKL